LLLLVEQLLPNRFVPLSEPLIDEILPFKFQTELFTLD
jgi:hypothetical protein